MVICTFVAILVGNKKLTMNWVRVPHACHGWTPGLLRKYIGKALGFGYCYGNINKTFLKKINSIFHGIGKVEQKVV